MLQLATGCVNVLTARLSDGCLDANACKTPDEFSRTSIRGRLEARALDLVELDDVDVCEIVTTEVAESAKLILGVVDSPDECILIGRSTTRLVNVFTHHLIQMQERELAHPRHEGVTRLLDG